MILLGIEPPLKVLLIEPICLLQVYYVAVGRGLRSRFIDGVYFAPRSLSLALTFRRSLLRSNHETLSPQISMVLQHLRTINLLLQRGGGLVEEG